MRRNVRASLSAIAASALLAFIGPQAGFAAAPAAMPALPPSLPSATGPQEVDVELVLAIDTSGSIDYQEAELQRKGIAEAFLSKDVIQAIQSGSLGRIGVSAIYFSSRAYGWMGVPVNWMIVRDQKSAEEFIHTLITAERHSGRGTSISDALELSQRMLERGPFRSAKQVIDVSGDGVNNAGRPVTDARDEVVGKGIIINGLPILSEYEFLDEYYRDRVIGGAGAFMEVVKDYDSFAAAVQAKLVREIAANEAKADRKEV